ALGVFADFVAQNPNTLLITTADSSAGAKGLILADSKVPKVGVNTGPNGRWVRVPLDGVDGAGTAPFLTAPDKAGNRWPFAVAIMSPDFSGGVVTRAMGLNAEIVTELGVVDNTDIYRIMYYILFGEWLGEARIGKNR
ncbi:alkaline phosphatase, partial [candidate division NPL-UPA2 bacterium]|nr:alkaline phosphatase [candidate division NPL-UPA2 bacterium]